VNNETFNENKEGGMLFLSLHRTFWYMYSSLTNKCTSLF